VYRDVIHSSPCLKRLRASALGDVCLRLHEVYAARGDQIIRGGAEPDGVFFIRAGQVRRRRVSRPVRQREKLMQLRRGAWQVLVTRGGETLRILGPGDAFGENCLVEPTLQEQPVLLHGMTALEPVEMVKLYLDDLELMVPNEPSWFRV